MVYCLKNLLHFEVRIFSSKNIYIFFSYQPITTATSTNMNPWNENIYLYLKKAYLPAWKLNVDYKSFKKKIFVCFWILIRKKIAQGSLIKTWRNIRVFSGKWLFLILRGTQFFCVTWTLTPDLYLCRACLLMPMNWDSAIQELVWFLSR